MRPSGESLGQSFVELVLVEPALGQVLAEVFDSLVALGITYSLRHRPRLLSHVLSLLLKGKLSHCRVEVTSGPAEVLWTDTGSSGQRHYSGSGPASGPGAVTASRTSSSRG